MASTHGFLVGEFQTICDVSTQNNRAQKEKLSSTLDILLGKFCFVFLQKQGHYSTQCGFDPYYGRVQVANGLMNWP